MWRPVEQSLPLPHPWRRTAIVASAFAVLELAAIVVLAVVLLGKPVADRVREHAQGPAYPKATKPEAVRAPAYRQLPLLTRADTSVLVLNGNGTQGAAGETAARVEGKGYLVAGAANAQKTSYRRSIVMYRKGRRAEANRLARDLKIRVVGPLDGLRPGQLMGAHLVVIVGDRS
jgi:LytR cell envelope-related transcriptional attenuator